MLFFKVCPKCFLSFKETGQMHLLFEEDAKFTGIANKKIKNDFDTISYYAKPINPNSALEKTA